MYVIVWGSGLITNIFISVNNILELRGRPDETNHINKAQGFLINTVMVEV